MATVRAASSTIGRLDCLRDPRGPRPLRRATAAARGLRAGRRDVRVPVEGPREVAEMGATINELAETLQRSEARQREFLLSVSHELRTPLGVSCRLGPLGSAPYTHAGSPKGGSEAARS